MTLVVYLLHFWYKFTCIANFNLDEFSNYGDYEYDYADATNLRNGRVKNEELHLETITNPYYGGNDYIEINGPTEEPIGLGRNVNTLKIVNNVYYE